MPYIDVENSRVHYLHKPGGPRPVVFLHGGFGSSAELWEGTMARLPAACSGYAIDNFLRSDAPPGGYNIAAFARRAGAFVQALGLPRAVFVGHSMGGVTCQLTALDYPEVVGALVLVCTGPTMPNPEVGRVLLDQLKAKGHEIGTLREISAEWFRVPPAGFFEGYVQRAAQAPLGAMVAVQQSLIDIDLTARLPEITVPALVVHGQHDRGRTIEHARRLVAGITGSRLAVMAHSGHTPMIETPADFDAAFHAFLATPATLA